MSSHSKIKNFCHNIETCKQKKKEAEIKCKFLVVEMLELMLDRKRGCLFDILEVLTQQEWNPSLVAGLWHVSTSNRDFSQSVNGTAPLEMHWVEDESQTMCGMNWKLGTWRDTLRNLLMASLHLWSSKFPLNNVDLIQCSTPTQFFKFPNQISSNLPGEN